MTGDEERYRALLAEMAREFPRFRLLPKEGDALQRSISMLLRIITGGAQSAYLTRYVTTLGQRVYVPSGWDARPAVERIITLRHERVHLRQFRRWTLLGMAIAYLLLPLPIGLAWCRYRLEREAYEETLRAAAEEHGKRHVCSAAFRDEVVAQFCSGAYGWMWPFPAALERWYDRTLATIPDGTSA